MVKRKETRQGWMDGYRDGIKRKETRQGWTDGGMLPW